MKKDITLIIDTRSSVKTVITLVSDGKKKEVSIQTNQKHSQAVLPLIEKLLFEQHLTPSDITRIEVSVDTGSYTGRRVGVAIAQTLAFLLHIPVNGENASEPIDISYKEDKWNI